MVINFDATPWREMPNGGQVDEHIFAIPDIHGRADILEEALKRIDKIARAKDLRTIVFLGDLIDRGPQGSGVHRNGARSPSAMR